VKIYKNGVKKRKKNEAKKLFKEKSSQWHIDRKRLPRHLCA
jgi:hypothetical protein